MMVNAPEILSSFLLSTLFYWAVENTNVIGYVLVMVSFRGLSYFEKKEKCQALLFPSN